MDNKLVEQIKAKMPDFSDSKKLENLEVRATKLHEREGKYSKQVFNNFAQALTEIESKLKSKHKIAKELCKAYSGRFVIVFELPQAEAKKALDRALLVARNEYTDWISNQQEEWLNLQLESALQEQAKTNAEKEQKANIEFKAALLEALQAN